MKSLGVTIIIPSYQGDVEGVLSELKTQGMDRCDYVIKRNISPVALARNLGAQEATGEYLIFLDDDVKFNNPNVLEDVLKTLMASGHKDAVNITWRLAPDANWIQRKLSGDPLFTFERSGHDVEMSWRECGAACFAIRSDWFSALGGYDERLTSGEDCDLAYRIFEAGGKIYTLPHYWIEHKPPLTLKGAIAKIFWYERGNAQVARKHPKADYRINLDRPWKAIVYLFLRSLAFFPLIFFKVNYRQRLPIFELRPFEAFLSYLGAWAYVREWLFPSTATVHSTTQPMMKHKLKEMCPP